MLVMLPLASILISINYQHLFTVLLLKYPLNSSTKCPAVAPLAPYPLYLIQ